MIKDDFEKVEKLAAEFQELQIAFWKGFPEHLKEERKAANLRQRDLAEAVGRTVGYIGHLEMGIAHPSPDITRAIIEVLYVKKKDPDPPSAS